MLLGAALMVEFMGDGGDDARLPARLACGRNVGERAQLRARAVGGGDQAGFDRAPVVQRQRSDEPLLRQRHDGADDPLDPRRIGGARQRLRDVVVIGHPGERGAVGIGEAELLQPHGVLGQTVEDLHFQDRLRINRQRRPGAEPLDQRPRAGADRHRAQLAVFARGRADQRHLGAHARLAFEGGCERKAHRAGADDGDVENGIGSG